MELKIPNSEQAYWGLRAMKTLASADGKLDDSEVHIVASVQVQRVIETAHPVDTLLPSGKSN